MSVVGEIGESSPSKRSVIAAAIQSEDTKEVFATAAAAEAIPLEALRMTSVQRWPTSVLVSRLIRTCLQSKWSFGRRKHAERHSFER